MQQRKERLRLETPRASSARRRETWPPPAGGWKNPGNRYHTKKAGAGSYCRSVAWSQVKEGGGRPTPTAEMGPQWVP